MFESNYDNCFAGVGDGAKADVANGKNIISKQDSKLKKIGRRKRRATTLDPPPVFRAKNVQRLPKWLPKWSRYPEKSNPKID